MQLATLVSVVVSLFGIAHALPTASNGTAVGAAYFMTNEPTGNYLVTHDIHPDGTVTWAGAYSVDGKGAHGIDTTTGGSGNVVLMPDPLFSQYSVKVWKDIVFALNAGTNTIVAFQIDKTKPSSLKMIGQPTPTGGDFPISITISPVSGELCVLNAGKINNVNCFWMTNGGLKPVPNSKQSIGLNQTSPGTGPNFSASQILFSDDGSELLVTVKGSWIPDTIRSRIATWKVNKDGSISDTYKNTSFPTKDQFAFALWQIPGKDAYVVSDTGLGAMVYDLSTNPNNVTWHDIPLEKQTRTCWVVYSEKSDSYWLSDTGTGKNGAGALYNIKLDDKFNAASTTRIVTTKHNPVDIAIANINGKEYIYALSTLQLSIDMFPLDVKGSDNKPEYTMTSYDFGKAMQKSKVKLNGLNLQGLDVYVMGSDNAQYTPGYSTSPGYASAAGYSSSPYSVGYAPATAAAPHPETTTYESTSPHTGYYGDFSASSSQPTGTGY